MDDLPVISRAGFLIHLSHPSPLLCPVRTKHNKSQSKAASATKLVNISDWWRGVDRPNSNASPEMSLEIGVCRLFLPVYRAHDGRPPVLWIPAIWRQPRAAFMGPSGAMRISNLQTLGNSVSTESLMPACSTLYHPVLFQKNIRVCLDCYWEACQDDLSRQAWMLFCWKSRRQRHALQWSWLPNKKF